jgi:uncharacterized protein YcgI (DUF1989 family)
MSSDDNSTTIQDNFRFSYPRAMLTVAARRAEAFEVKEGERFQIVDQQGKQTFSLVAFKKDDLTEYVSPSHTREGLNSIMLRLNANIVSNRRNWMLRLEEDNVGRHDMTFPLCDGRRYLDYYGLPDHPNSRDSLATVLADHGITYDKLPDPINFFMHVSILRQGGLEIREPLSEPGDFVVLRALTNLIVGVVASPDDCSARNGRNPTDLLVRVFNS